MLLKDHRPAVLYPKHALHTPPWTTLLPSRSNPSIPLHFLPRAVSRSSWKTCSNRSTRPSGSLATFGLPRMARERLLRLGRLGTFGKARQYLNQLLFGVVDVLQLSEKKLLQGPRLMACSYSLLRSREERWAAIPGSSVRIGPSGQRTP